MTRQRGCGHTHLLKRTPNKQLVHQFGSVLVIVHAFHNCQRSTLCVWVIAFTTVRIVPTWGTQVCNHQKRVMTILDISTAHIIDIQHVVHTSLHTTRCCTHPMHTHGVTPPGTNQLIRFYEIHFLPSSLIVSKSKTVTSALCQQV